MWGALQLILKGGAMRFFTRHLNRCVFALFAAIVMFGEAQAGIPLAPDLPAGAVDRVERKRLAAEGKLPLPGTPDLAKLDERLASRHVTRDASIMIRIFKAESELEVWMTTNTGAVHALRHLPRVLLVRHAWAEAQGG